MTDNNFCSVTQEVWDQTWKRTLKCQKCSLIFTLWRIYMLYIMERQYLFTYIVSQFGIHHFMNDDDKGD